ncbi:hypothetical protein Goshw_024353 [Gossypium schwendimanii]|uniref:Uncharacterized protein n=1 Tax=Gossypium schwendimanii TaxID=34291 RepID=A0A7J9MK34_GOSSC|nr:hypothetical protein [Gossypium schwendimanii]
MKLANKMFYEWQISRKDVALVSCMVELCNIGSYNTDTRFKTDYLNELERMLENFLPHAMLKAKPNLELSFPFYTNVLPYMQKIEPLGKMLKQLQMLLKK